MSLSKDDYKYIKHMFLLKDDLDVLNLYCLLHFWNEKTLQYYESIVLSNWYSNGDFRRMITYLSKNLFSTSDDKKEFILKVFSPIDMEYLLNYCKLSYLWDDESLNIRKKLNKIAEKNWYTTIHTKVAFYHLWYFFDKKSIPLETKKNFIEKVFSPKKFSWIIYDLWIWYELRYDYDVDEDIPPSEIREEYKELWIKNGFSEFAINAAINLVNELDESDPISF